MNARPRAAIASCLTLTLAAVAAAACGGRGTRTSEDWASVERAAIDHDLKNDVDSLHRIAATRARLANRALREKKVTCATSNIDVQFVGNRKAIYTVSYACGVAPWQPGQSPPAATPTIKVEVLKESSTWKIDTFL